MSFKYWWHVLVLNEEIYRPTQHGDTYFDAHLGYSVCEHCGIRMDD